MCAAQNRRQHGHQQPHHIHLALAMQDSWEVKPDGHVSMLGKSLRGDYVFSSDGDLIKAAGQTATFYKVGGLGAVCCATAPNPCLHCYHVAGESCAVGYHSNVPCSRTCSASFWC